MRGASTVKLAGWRRLVLVAAVVAPATVSAQTPYSVKHERFVSLKVDILSVGAEGTSSMGSTRIDVLPTGGGSAEVDLAWGSGARLRLDASGEPGKEGEAHSVSLHAALTIGAKRVVSNRDLVMREESTYLMDVYEEDRQRLVLVLRAEAATRPVVETKLVETVGAPVRLRLQVDRIDGERVTSLETNDLNTFVGQSVAYSFQRGEGESAESVRLVLLPVRIRGAVTEMEIEVTGSLPGEPDRLLLSRRETLVSNRGTLSALTVTSGDPPAGYRFSITPEF
jgi:hypothetical protein